MQKGASKQSTEKSRGARRGRTGPGPVGLGQPAWPILSLFRAPLWPRCSSINCLYLRRPPHPSIHQRVTDTKEKHREEVDSRRESSSCLGDGLGHALSAMVGPTWWSHGGVLEPMPWFHHGNCTPTLDGDINHVFSLLCVTSMHVYSYVYLAYALSRNRVHYKKYFDLWQNSHDIF
jgi:hypothetical protein